MSETKIETKRLTLRYFTHDDAKAVTFNSQQPIVAKWIPDMILKNEKESLEWIEWINDKCQVSEIFKVFAIEKRKDRKCIGLIGYAPKEEINNEIEILYSIADPYQSQGFATEAAKALIWYAFQKMGLNMLSAIIKPDNIASRKVIEKLGFIYGDTRKLNYNGEITNFNYYRLYHIEYIPDPQWKFNYCVEEMTDFFDVRADGYDSHIIRTAADIEGYKRAVKPIKKCNEEIKVLDLGCGTGLEIEHILQRAPNANITCIDKSSKMLEKLRTKYITNQSQIKLICHSYISWDYPYKTFDYVFSSLTMHHFDRDIKFKIYKNILDTLKPGGVYIEYDFIVNKMMMKQYQARYKRIIKELSDRKYKGYYHIDIPHTIELQKEFLINARFSDVSVFHEDIKPSGSNAILIAEKQDNT